MHVALLAPAPWDTLSGGYIYDRAIVAGLRDAGHRVDVHEIHGRHPLPDAAAHTSAAEHLDAVPHDAVIVIDGLCLPAFAPLASRLAARGAVGLVHHPTAFETGRDEASRETLQRIECALLPTLRRVVVTSEDTAQRLTAQFGVAAARVAVVVPGTAAAPRSPGPSRTDCLIVSLASLLPRKGHDVLLRALARLGDLQWELVIAGGSPDPVYAASLQALSAELGIAERVRFVGAIPAADLTPLWDKAGFFALATWYEGYGMAIAEALRRGLPVAVTAGGAAAALVGPECAVVCPPGDHAALSRGMRRMIYDRTLRQAMAEAAWQVGRSLPDWPAQATRFAVAMETP